MGTMTKHGTDLPIPEHGQGVSRLMVLGYYDGAEEGVVQLADSGPCYLFLLTENERRPDDIDRRTYTLRPLPDGAFDELIRLVEPHIAPSWPVWNPIWTFASAEIRRDVDEKVDGVLAKAGRVIGTLTTDNPYTFAEWSVQRGDAHVSIN